MRKNKLIVSLAVGSVLASLSGMALAANGIVHEPQLSTASVEAATRESNHCSAPALLPINLTPELEVTFLPGADHMRPELMLASQNDEGELFGPWHKLEFVAAEQTLRPWQTSPMLASNDIGRPWQTSPMLAAEQIPRPWQTFLNFLMLSADPISHDVQDLALLPVDKDSQLMLATGISMPDPELQISASKNSAGEILFLASGNAEGELFGPMYELKLSARKNSEGDILFMASKTGEDQQEILLLASGNSEGEQLMIRA